MFYLVILYLFSVFSWYWKSETLTVISLSHDFPLTIVTWHELLTELGHLPYLLATVLWTIQFGLRKITWKFLVKAEKSARPLADLQLEFWSLRPSTCLLGLLPLLQGRSPGNEVVSSQKISGRYGPDETAEIQARLSGLERLKVSVWYTKSSKIWRNLSFLKVVVRRMNVLSIWRWWLVRVVVLG